jgi:hypothetical protein
MFAFLTKLLLIARSRLKSRASLEAENLVLRQQVIVLSRQSRSRVRLRNMDRLIFVWLYRFFPAILNAITVVKPETLIRWHRRGFGPIGAGNPADVVAAPRSTATSIPSISMGGWPLPPGRHSRVTMPLGSNPSICSWFVLSLSSCSMAWSFFATPEGD